MNFDPKKSVGVKDTSGSIGIVNHYQKFVLDTTHSLQLQIFLTPELGLDLSSCDSRFVYYLFYLIIS